jgi:hypothetical protein
MAIHTEIISDAIRTRDAYKDQNETEFEERWNTVRQALEGIEAIDQIDAIRKRLKEEPGENPLLKPIVDVLDRSFKTLDRHRRALNNEITPAAKEERIKRYKAIREVVKAYGPFESKVQVLDAAAESEKFRQDLERAYGGPVSDRTLERALEKSPIRGKPGPRSQRS